MSTNAKTRYNISKVFGPAVPDKGSKAVSYTHLTLPTT